MRNVAISALAFVLAIVAIFLANATGTALIEPVVRGGLTTDQVPVTGAAQALVLAVNFGAGAAGAVLLVLIALNRPLMHAFIYFGIVLFGIVLVLDTVSAVFWWGQVPTWFTIAMAALAPLQVWAGTVAGLHLRRRWRKSHLVSRQTFR